MMSANYFPLALALSGDSPSLLLLVLCSLQHHWRIGRWTLWTRWTRRTRW
eukprot:SAG31_NODE_22893_length_516_cov_0.563549_2_plen_49_part_01